MGHRLLEAVAPVSYEPRLREAAEQSPSLGSWIETAEGWDHVRARLLVDEQDAEAALNAISERFDGVEGFRIVLLSVEATVPRIPLPEDDEDEDGQPREAPEGRTARISAEELYADVTDSFNLTQVWMALVALSAIVAALGLQRDATVVVIGAMVIAPLLGPNMGLALATTLADGTLARRAIKVSLAGVSAVLAISLLLGNVLIIDPGAPELVSRTEVGLQDMALALASGAAGALSFTMGLSAALVGVMVAVALLPPLVAAGLFLGAGHVDLAAAAGLLTLVNLICVNLAGVVTFAWQGIRPRTYWEADKARRATIAAITAWILMALALAGAILVLGPRL